MHNARRVYITGHGAITASGSSGAATWDALLAGEQAFAPATQWDVSSWDHRLCGEIKGYEGAKLLPDRKLMKVISRQDVLGINAAQQAIVQSGLLDYRETLACAERFNEDTGIFVGSPGNKYYQQYDFLSLLQQSQGDMRLFAEQLFQTVHPMWLLRILPNNVLAYTGITYQFHGINHNVTNHAVSGTQALIEAYHAVMQGQAERAVVVAYDVGHEPQAWFYYEKLGVVSARDLRPFDRAHDGTILAEGAAAIVIESDASARARGATCYAEIVGGQSRTENGGLFSIEPEGDALAKLLTDTLAAHAIDPHHIGMVVAHGNGNPASDTSEAKAIGAVFADHAVPVTAFKWSMGHTLCASGLIDTVLACHSMQQKTIPGIANLQQPEATAKGLSLAAQSRDWDVSKPYAMLINRGFAGMNACLVMKHCE